MSKAVFDYVKVNTVATQLQQANLELNSELANLLSTVSNLLMSGGGLYMEQSSPALHDAYSHFSATLTNAMNNIGNFASKFGEIKDNLAKFDTDTHGAIVKAATEQK